MIYDLSLTHSVQHKVKDHQPTGWSM